mgnify:CR=1 FL=1
MGKKKDIKPFGKKKQAQYERVARLQYGAEIVNESVKLWNSYGKSKQEAIMEEGGKNYRAIVKQAGPAVVGVTVEGMHKASMEERGLPPVVLSRAIGDSATVTSPLIPWNSCGAYMAATLGVATWSYAPYAVFSIVSPLLTVAIAYAGIRMLRVPPGASAPSAAPAPVPKDSGA